MTLEEAVFVCLNPQLPMAEARRCAHEYSVRAHRLEAERPSRAEAERDERECPKVPATREHLTLIRGAFVEMLGEDEMGVGGTD